MDLQIAADWLALVVRWLHVIFGVAWIGTSFYFNWLNNHVRPVEAGEAPAGVAGELWSVHGGKFYRVLKYRVAPERLPTTLHWFKYEAYFTWISGFTLLALVYYLEPTAYLVDSTVRDLDEWVAIAIGVGTLVGGWGVYHLMCKSPLGRVPVPFAVVGFALVTALAFGLTQVFGSRAAYIHVGALIGTLMAWNVFFVIIPNQKKVVAAMERGEEPEPRLGEEGAQRSLHNNYFTLPVLFIMVSNHYPMTFGHEWSWAILAALSLIGASVRHWFNLQGQGRKNVWLLPVAALAMVALALVSSPRPDVYEGEVTFAMVQGIVEERCLECHSATPTSDLYDVAPQGVMFDTPQQIQDRAARINTQVVVTQQMPLSNLTGITDEERAIIGAWYQQGAPID
ncbi:MAG TPA: urate hydroxylase PuuD [Sandaracinaceae bacterium LLY-WYZ-13_1]|nr:urate hydroxylase PuuD [Sandaracinaceae bacterium LLY-WYZ-13_1]